MARQRSRCAGHHCAPCVDGGDESKRARAGESGGLGSKDFNDDSDAAPGNRIGEADGSAGKHDALVAILEMVI